MLRPVFFLAVSTMGLVGCATAPTACVPASPMAAAVVAAPVAAPAPVADSTPAPTPAAVPGQLALPDPTMYDAPLAAAIVGSWIVPRVSSDFRPSPVREVYRKDGTYTLYYFDKRDCNKVVGQVDATWRIERSNLIATVTSVSTRQYGHVGDISTDVIVSMAPNTMVLRSTHDSVFSFASNKDFTRWRSEGCYDDTSK